MYGVSYIFDGKNFIQFDKTQKYRRKKYKRIMQQQGIDWSLVQKDYAPEITKMALIAWVGVAKYLGDMLVRTGKAYWLKGRETPVKKLIKKRDNTTNKFPPPKSKWEEELDWKEIADSLNINPQCSSDESITLTIIDLVSCLANKTESHDEYILSLLSKNESIVDEIYDTYLEGKFESKSDDDEYHELSEYLYELLTEDEDDYDEETHTYNGNSIKKLSTLAEAVPLILKGECDLFQVEAEEDDTEERPQPPKERAHYAGDEDTTSTAVSVRGKDGKFLPGNQVASKKSILANIPKLACDTCYAADNCPYFEPKSVCYYDKELNKYDTRNIDDVINILSDITNITVQRMMIARIFEQLDGGMPDRLVTDLINQSLFAVEQQRKVINAARNTGTGEGVLIASSGDKGNSILAKLFGDLGGEEKEPPKDVTPKKGSTVGNIFDAEWESVDEEETPKKKKVIKKKKGGKK